MIWRWYGDGGEKNASQNPAFQLKKPLFSRRLPFYLKFVKASTGEVVTVNQAVLTSSYECNRTYNIKLMPSGQIRKIRQLSVVEAEGEVVYLLT